MSVGERERLCVCVRECVIANIRSNICYKLRFCYWDADEYVLLLTCEMIT